MSSGAAGGQEAGFARERAQSTVSGGHFESYFLSADAGFRPGRVYLPGAHVARTRFFQEEVSHGREAFGMTPNHALRGAQTREGDSAQVGRH